IRRSQCQGHSPDQQGDARSLGSTLFHIVHSYPSGEEGFVSVVLCFNHTLSLDVDQQRETTPKCIAPLVSLLIAGTAWLSARCARDSPESLATNLASTVLCQ